MLEELIGKEIVIDLRSSFIGVGILRRVDDQFLELENADLHDLHDSETNRENYVAAVRRSGVIANRKRVLIVRAEVIAISRVSDVLG